MRDFQVFVEGGVKNLARTQGISSLPGPRLAPHYPDYL